MLAAAVVPSWTSHVFHTTMSLMTSGNQTRPGWFQDGSTPNIERFWDGSQWTSATRLIAVKKRHTVLKILGVVIVAFLAIGLWSAVSQTAARNASTPPTPSAIRTDYASINDRDLDLIVKDPESERGRRIALTAHVFQLDTRTGSSSMLVDAYADAWDSSPTRMVVDVVDAELLAPVVEGDSLTVFVEVWGTEEYETVEGVMRVDPRVVAGIIEPQ